MRFKSLDVEELTKAECACLSIKMRRFPFLSFIYQDLLYDCMYKESVNNLKDMSHAVKATVLGYSHFSRT